MKLYYSVFMDRRDVTSWVQALEIRQPRRTIYREFSLEFAGWAAIQNYQDGATWDIYSSVDQDNPRAEVEIAGGVIPPDRDRLVDLQPGKVPVVEITGYDRAWMIQRRRPSATIVVVPGSGFGEELEESVGYALERYDGPVGQYRVWTYTRTVHEAVRKLANEAGVRVDLRFPDREIRPFVVDPERSYYEAIRELVDPWSPEVYYRRSWNALVFVDAEAPRYGVGRTVELAARHIRRVQALPVRAKRIRRVLLRVAS